MRDHADLRSTLIGALIGMCTLALPACGQAGDSSPSVSGGDVMTLSVRSDSFSPEGAIPTEYTCEGEGRSPHLAWNDVPDGARSLALVVDDPDAPDPRAPQRTWVHWVVYNIPPTLDHLPEGASGALPGAAREGVNGWSRLGYAGPCPPIGRHRYFFKVYALDTILPDLDRPTKDDLVEAMQGHILGRGQVMATYEKQVRSRR